MNFWEASKGVVEGQLERLRKDRHRHCAAIVYNWLSEHAAKKPFPDLALRMERMRVEIYKMTETMELQFSNGTIVVKATGSSEQTLKSLKFGTDWFAPNPDVEAQIVAGLFKAGS